MKAVEFAKHMALGIAAIGIGVVVVSGLAIEAIRKV